MRQISKWNAFLQHFGKDCTLQGHEKVHFHEHGNRCKNAQTLVVKGSFDTNKKS